MKWGGVGELAGTFFSSCQTGSMGFKLGDDAGWKSNGIPADENQFCVDLLQ